MDSESKGRQVPGGMSLEAAVEAVLFSCEVPLPARRIAELVGSTRGEVLEALDRLNVFYGETGRAFRITPLAGGFQLVSLPEYREILSRLHQERVPTRLSRAALETLSIVAFKQPVTRTEIDAIRGVSASDGVLRHLLERKLVRIAGRAEAPGRPLLYGTTREFLAYFGLSSLADLPREEELKALLGGEGASSATIDQESPPAPVAGEEGASTSDPRGCRIVGEEAGEEPGVSSGEAPNEESPSHSGEESDEHEGVPAT